MGTPEKDGRLIFRTRGVVYLSGRGALGLSSS